VLKTPAQTFRLALWCPLPKSGYTERGSIPGSACFKLAAMPPASRLEPIAARGPRGERGDACEGKAGALLRTLPGWARSEALASAAGASSSGQDRVADGAGPSQVGGSRGGGAGGAPPEGDAGVSASSSSKWRRRRVEEPEEDADNIFKQALMEEDTEEYVPVKRRRALVQQKLASGLKRGPGAGGGSSEPGADDALPLRRRRRRAGRGSAAPALELKATRAEEGGACADGGGDADPEREGDA